MSDDGDGGNGTDMRIMVPKRPEVPHYHGDAVRAIFVISAIILILARSMSAELPLSTTGAVVSAVVLVIAAGITNPRTQWIHWVNAILAAGGSILFGVTAVAQYSAGESIFDPSFFYIEVLALLSLLALYFTTRTVRGILLRPYKKF